LLVIPAKAGIQLFALKLPLGLRPSGLLAKAKLPLGLRPSGLLAKAKLPLGLRPSGLLFGIAQKVTKKASADRGVPIRVRESECPVLLGFGGVV